MNPSLEQIEEEMAVGQLSPPTCADYRVILSALCSRAEGELEEILTVKPQIWQELREKTNSDRAATNAWSGTMQGLREMKLNLRIKRISRLISALSSILRTKELVAKNIF